MSSSEVVAVVYQWHVPRYSNHSLLQPSWHAMQLFLTYYSTIVVIDWRVRRVVCYDQAIQLQVAQRQHAHVLVAAPFHHPSFMPFYQDLVLDAIHAPCLFLYYLISTLIDQMQAVTGALKHVVVVQLPCLSLYFPCPTLHLRHCLFLFASSCWHFDQCCV